MQHSVTTLVLSPKIPLSASNETCRHGSCYSPSGIFPYEGLYLLSVGRGLVIRRAEYCREKISTYTVGRRFSTLRISLRPQ